MKLIDALLLSLAAAFIIIGIYEMMTVGVEYAYTYIMLSVVLFFYYMLRKKKSNG